MHLITVNDYLATRDAEWMGRLHRWLGLERRASSSRATTTPAHKREQYAADITYGTNNEFGFDYLRDNMAPSRARQVQRGHTYAIVDEVDSILIDEARTPLIISGRVADAAQLYYKFATIVRSLQRDDDYEVDEEKRTVVAHRGRHREGRAASSASRTSTTAWPRTSSTSSRPPSRPRSCSSATRTTSSATAR